MKALTEIVKIENNGSFFEDATYLPMNDAVDIPLVMLDYQTFTNDKGDGVAILCTDGKDRYKIVTHSAPIVSVMQTEDIMDVLADGEEVTFTITKNKSKRTGREYFCFA